MKLHASHKKESRQAFLVAGCGLLIMLLLSLWPAGETVRGIASYLPLHMLLETMAIVAALQVFAIVWSARQQALPCNLIILGVSAFAAAILDFSHMLSYHGMPEFVTASDPEKAINFWLAARLFSAIGLLTAAFVSWQIPLKISRSWFMLLSALAITSLLHVLFLYYPHLVARTFIQGSGLTPLKIYSEYLLIVLLLVAGFKYMLAMGQPRSYNASGFFAATILMAQGEFFFTLYSDVTDIYNLAGHVYKVLGYVFLYRAVFVEAVQRPYELLDESRAQLDETLNALPDLLFEIDLHGNYLQVYTPEREHLVQSAQSLLGKNIADTLSAEATKTVLEALNEAHQQGFSKGKMIEIQLFGDKHLWFELSVVLRTSNRNAQQASFLVVSRDVTDKLRVEQSLHTISQAVEQNPLAILVLDKELHIQQANQAFYTYSGYRFEEVHNKHPKFLHSDKNPPFLVAEITRSLSAGKAWKGEVICNHKDGREYVELVRVFPVRDSRGEVCNYLAIKEDISENKSFAAKLEQVSNHDQLTGLPNRNLLQKHFDAETANGRHIALVWMDLDNVKEVNDALGYAAGDLLLKQVAFRLRDCLHGAEVLARIAGDDFVILLSGTRQGRVALRVQQLLESLSAPFVLPGQTLSVTASAGIAVYPLDAQTLPDLLQKAEVGKYKAKEAGRNNYQFYEAKMQEKAALRLAQSNALKQAIENDELFLVYQPQVSLLDGRMVGVEALLRWRTQQWGLVSPLDFIPLAESNGMIIPIGDWVIKTALQQMAQWRQQGLPSFSIAVNISAIQFEQPALVEIIQRHLDKTGVPADLLDLELTEAVAMKNPELSEQRINQLHELNVRLSIDDFGTGYSSLSYLKRFKIDKLKIDREFIREMDVDSDDQAITTAVIQMAQQLSITTLAEGVETASQLELLKQYGCEQVQGYYFSKPLLPDELVQFLK